MQTGHVTTADGVRIAYAAHGEGSPLVFVRGWFSHLETMWEDPPFRAYFEALGEQFRVVRFDMRGNGLSQREIGPVGLTEMAADLEAVMDGLELQHAVVYGQCFGGPCAIAYAAAHAHRVSKLILDGTYAQGARLARPERQRQVISTLRDIPEAGLAFLTHLTHPNPEASSFRQHNRSGANMEMATAVQLYTLGFRFDVSSLLPRVTMPTLVLHRTTTRAIPFRLGRELASSIRGARLVPLQGQAHNTWEESPEAAIEALSEFLGVPLHLDAIEETAERLLAILVVSAVGEETSDGVSTRDIIANATRRNNGVEITHTGAEFMAFFASAPGAVECATVVQQDLEGRANVRIGVHAGEPVFQGGESADTVVNVAKQACADAAPSEIVVTEAIRDACAGHGFLFVERGAEDGEEPSKLFVVRWSSGS